MRHLLTILFIFMMPVFSLGQDSSGSRKSVGLTISLPWTNNYSYYDHDLKTLKNKSGFFGLGASVFYKHKNKLSLNFGLTGDLPAPIGPLDFAQEGTRTNIFAIYVEGLYHKKIYKKLNVIGGINFINYRFGFISYVDSLPEYFKNDITIGLTAGIEYSLFKRVEIAVFYRPTLFSFDTKQYKHIISLDTRFDINLTK